MKEQDLLLKHSLETLKKVMNEQEVLLKYGLATLKGADMSGCLLPNSDLRGVDLSGANLRDASLRRSNLRGANLSGANLSGCVLAYADLEGANLEGADLSEATLKGANFTNTCINVLGMLNDIYVVYTSPTVAIGAGCQAFATFQDAWHYIDKEYDESTAFYRECWEFIRMAEKAAGK